MIRIPPLNDQNSMESKAVFFVFFVSHLRKSLAQREQKLERIFQTDDIMRKTWDASLDYTPEKTNMEP